MAGWAISSEKGVEDRGLAPPTSLLGNAPTTLVGIGGSSRRTYDKYGYAEARRTQIDVGTFAYCGITDVESHLIFDVEGDHNAPVREEGLTQVSDVVRTFASSTRVVRNAKEDHLRRRSDR